MKQYLPGLAAQGLSYNKDESAAWFTHKRNVVGPYKRRAMASRPARSRKHRRK